MLSYHAHSVQLTTHSDGVRVLAARVTTNNRRHQ